ncbi:hypothetical protein MMC13_002240 [Lambiella insularis]|nr:hypothetical protein [Lambiella insularis]
MASPIPQKRSFEVADLDRDVQYHEVSVPSIPVFPDPIDEDLQCDSTHALDAASRETSPLSSAATSASREPSVTPTTSTMIATPNATKPPKRRKLTFAEKEVQRLEKQIKDQQKAEEKARKDEERRLKEEEMKEAKRRRDEEREEKRKLREVEKQFRDEEKKKRDVERQAKENEKLRKEKSQLRLNSFFTKPAIPVGGSEDHDRSGPSSRRSSIASLGCGGTDLRSCSVSLIADQVLESEYTRSFQPFFVHLHTEVAPSNKFISDEEGLRSSQRIMDESVLTMHETESKVVSSVKELMLIPSNKRKKTFPCAIPVKALVASIHGNANDLIDLTNASGHPNQNTVELLRKAPVKYLRYAEDVRPPYIGTYSKLPYGGSASRLCRRPFLRALPSTNYDYDSEAEWEEPGEGEDLDSEGEEEIGDDEPGDDMEEFLDDDDADGNGAKRRNIMGDVQPVCTGLLWEGEVKGERSRVIAHGETSLDLRAFRISLLLGDSTWPLDPYTTSYWPSSAKATTGESLLPTTKQASMAPPRVPLNTIQRTNNILPLSSTQNGTDLKNSHSLSSPLRPRTAKSKSAVPSKPVPSELLEDFKKAIDGSDLSKAGLIEVLKKRFPQITKGTVQDTLALVAERAGKKESDKRWRLL